MMALAANIFFAVTDASCQNSFSVYHFSRTLPANGICYNSKSMIRQFNIQDAQYCCNLIHNCIREDLSISDSLRKKLLEIETPQSMVERARLFYVAVYEQGSGIQGIAGLDLNEIRLLCVAPECQRSGIGRALLKHITTMTPKYFFKELFVYSSVSAVDFYKSQGFVEKGQVSFNLGGEIMRTLFMILPLQ
jgi:N-acetylglutamate synthase-like GNAT family acetyltransferase